MKFKIKILLFGLILIAAAGCKKEWDEHYNIYPETVDENVWDVIQGDPKFSSFIEIVKQAQMDTLFESDIAYTIFAPTNDAISNFEGISELNDLTLAYHFCSHFINVSSIQGKRQIQTLTEKFALFERQGSKVTIDEIEVQDESPLYRNGKFFTMDEVIEPKPNLYQYYEFTNPVLSNYIDTQDTIIIDKEKSKPLGFDENGNTVYDTVSIIANKFEMKYFPVKEEFRNLSSTVVFPKEEDYQGALDIMADALGDDYIDHKDIPLDWQEEILIPHLLYQGVFLNRLEPEEFVWESPEDTLKLLNVLGDSVVITYLPTDKALCSNGYAYNYDSFEIPDSLYQGGTKMEGEDLVNPTGLNKYAWKDSVTVVSNNPMPLSQELIQGASNDSIIRVTFPKGHQETYSIEFKSPKLFPRKYQMVISTHMDIGGIYDIYVNGELVKTFDYYQYILYRGVIFSVTGERFIPRGRFNRFDMYVENLVEYGNANIKIEYKGPSFVASNGLVIDYIDFIPAVD